MDADADAREEDKRQLKRLAVLRQVRQADDKVGHLRSNAADSSHRHRQKLHAHQEHPQIQRAGRNHQTETEAGEGCAEEKPSQDQQAPPPEEEDEGGVNGGRRGVHLTLLDKKHRQIVQSLCR